MSKIFQSFQGRTCFCVRKPPCPPLMLPQHEMIALNCLEQQIASAKPILSFRHSQNYNTLYHCKFINLKSILIFGTFYVVAKTGRGLGIKYQEAGQLIQTLIVFFVKNISFSLIQKLGIPEPNVNPLSKNTIKVTLLTQHVQPSLCSDWSVVRSGSNLTLVLRVV